MSTFPLSSPCPCGSSRHYGECCAPYHQGVTVPDTAEKLMRSRYSAFYVRNGDYLLATLASEKRSGFDPQDIAQDQTRWTGLKIVDRVAGGVLDQTGQVEFIASFTENGKPGRIHERSNFERRDGKWYYVDGVFPDLRDGTPGTTTPHSAISSPSEPTKIGRNAPCPCGSGKKFKKCCG